MTHPPLSAARRVAHVTLQPLASDARVNRALDAMRGAGLDCPVIGPGFGVTPRVMDRRAKAEIALAYGASRAFGTGRLGERAARAAFYSRPEHREAKAALLAARPDAIHAHDWDGLIVADDVARTLGIPFIYDAHEFAAEMHAERRGWRAVVAPLIRRLEGPAARRAAHVVSVSEGLGRILKERLALAEMPVTLRNIPDTPTLPPEPRDAVEIGLLYHGILAEGRGLEALVEGVLTTDAPCRLVLRGPWRQERLKRMIAAMLAIHPEAHRVSIEPAVPFDDLVPRAAASDVGVCLLGDDTVHNRIALPNKLFEYLHAGLGLLVSGSDEMRAVVERHGCGLALGPVDGPSIAAELAKLDRARIEMWRRQAGQSAEEFTWNREKRKLLALYGR